MKITKYKLKEGYSSRYRPINGDADYWKDRVFNGDERPGGDMHLSIKGVAEKNPLMWDFILVDATKAERRHIRRQNAKATLRSVRAYKIKKPIIKRMLSSASAVLSGTILSSLLITGSDIWKTTLPIMLVCVAFKMILDD